MIGLAVLVPAAGQVVGSKHDLSVGGGGMWGSTETTRVCVFCHVPHAGSGERPLWNRSNPSATWQVYASSTLDAAVPQPNAETLLCLSCHDGVTALNGLVNPANVFAMPAIGDQLGDVYYPGAISGMGPNIGGSYPGNASVNDLSDDHPVSIVFDAALVSQDGALRLPTAGEGVRLRGPAGNTIECTSCHDPHRTTDPPFLVMSNSGSALCRTCHLK